MTTRPGAWLSATALLALVVPFAFRSAYADQGPPLYPSDQRDPLFIFGRVGIGLDSNVTRSNQNIQKGILIREELRTEWEPITDLRLQLSGTLDEDGVTTTKSIYDNASAEITYQHLTSRHLFFSSGLLTVYEREPSVFLNGSVLTAGAALRKSLLQRLHVTWALLLGPIDLELGGRGEAERVDGIERFTEIGSELMGGIRAIVLPSVLSLRVRYTFGRQLYIGRQSFLLEESQQPDDTVSTQGVRASARFQPFSGLVATLHFDQNWITDLSTGFLTGQRQHARIDIFAEFGGFSTELGSDLAFRKYTNRLITVDDPSRETSVDAWIDLQWRLTGPLGIFARYEFQRIAAEPTGLLFSRHVALIGPFIHLSP